MKNNFDFTKSYIKPFKQEKINVTRLNDVDRMTKINENMKNLNKYNSEHNQEENLKTRMDNLKNINKRI